MTGYHQTRHQCSKTNNRTSEERLAVAINNNNANIIIIIIKLDVISMRSINQANDVIKLLLLVFKIIDLD